MDAVESFLLLYCLFSLLGDDFLFSSDVLQGPEQITSQGALHPALAAVLPGMGGKGSVIGPSPAPAAAPAPASKPPVLGTPTFCLLVKNMFDPATETEEGWELDIKEEMEEVRVQGGETSYWSASSD